MIHNVQNFTILGIESSCDETAASVYQTAIGVRSNVLFSQIDLHKKYGGVVPEIASRSHIEKINSIVQEALNKASCTLDDIDAIAVTNKPGLPGSLLIGVCFSKALAFAKHKKIIGVNHLEGHAFSASIENQIPFPHICLTASGGHTAVYIVHGYGDYQIIAQTTDDAAGEAFDKVAKLMNLPYPGGPIIEDLAKQVNFNDFYHFPRLKETTLNFSFSGLKTAVLYHLVNQKAYSLEQKKFLAVGDIALQQKTASSFLICVADIFEQRLKKIFKLYPEIQALTFVGGVACNTYLKTRLATFAKQQGRQFFSPSTAYCTDNAAMIAFVGHYKAQQGKFSDLTLDIY